MKEKLFEAILNADDIGDDGLAAAMFPVKEGQRDVSIMMYITNATPTKEYLQESFTPGRCWDDWYNIILKRIPFDDNPDEMRKALNTIDKIHAETGAFKNAGVTDKYTIDKCCEILAGASDYELYNAFEEMCEYFGW